MSRTTPDNSTTGRGRGRILKYTLSLIITIALFATFVFALLPDEFLGEVVKREARKAGGVEVNWSAFGKRFPLGFVGSNLSVGGSKASPYFSISSLKGDIGIMPLLFGKADVVLRGIEGDGYIEAAVKGERGGAASVDFVAHRLPISTMTFLRGMGFDATLVGGGSVSGTGAYSLEGSGCGAGSLDIRASGLPLGDLNIPGAELLFQGILGGGTVEGGLKGTTSECKVLVDNLWLKDENLSLKVSGTIGLGGGEGTGGAISGRRAIDGASLDLTVELTSSGDSFGNPITDGLLKKYKRSSRYYEVKVGGTVGRPVIR